MIGDPSQYEQQIGEAVKISKHLYIHRGFTFRTLSAGQRNRFALGAAAHRARHVQRGRERRTSRQNEVPKRRKLPLEAIDPYFQLTDAFRGDPTDNNAPVSRPSFLGRSNIGAQNEEVVLACVQNRINFRVRGLCARRAKEMICRKW